MDISNILKTIRFSNVNVSEVSVNPIAAASVHIKNYNGNMTTPMSTTDMVDGHAADDDVDDDGLSGIDRIYHHHIHVPVPYHNHHQHQGEQLAQQHQLQLQLQQQHQQQQQQLQNQQKQNPFLRQLYHPQMDLTFGGVNPYVGDGLGAGAVPGTGGFYFPHGYV